MGAGQVACSPSPLPNEGHSPEGWRAERAAGVFQMEGRWALLRDAAESHLILGSRATALTRESKAR